ncbi:MAG: FmdB family transcriptional regulator [Ignavibacteria bacterium]
MPIYDYRCNDCGTTYDIFHKVREVPDDVVCPTCQSTNHTRLLSASHVAISGVTSSTSTDLGPSSCDSGACCGGACGLE